MTKKIPILSSDFKVVYQDGKEWIEYNRFISLTEAKKKAEELNKKGMKTKVVNNTVREMEIEVPKSAVKDGPY